MKSHGLPTRRMQNETVPKQQSQLSQLSQLSTQPVEEQDQALLRFGKITVMQGELPVGEGSYGTVLKGLMPYGRFCALKIFKGSKAMISLKQEVLIFKKECGNSFLPCWKSNADRSRSPTWLWSLLGQACPKCSSIMVLSLEVQCSA